MLATITRVWPGAKVTQVFAREQGRLSDTRCYVYMTTTGAWIASLCERAEANGGGGKVPIVLTLKPKTRWGHEIEAAELVPQEASAS